MREIKFRAWHKELKEMFYDVSVDTKQWVSRNSHRQGELDTAMQFTGLKDKNGKEIYEGDIVKLGTEDHNHLIEYVEYKFCLTDFEGWCQHDLDYKEDFIEVIGNKFENPELLK